jgi:hypothetical protein
MPLFQLCGDEAADARSKYYLFPSPQAGILSFNFWEENPRNFAMEIVLWRSRYYLFSSPVLYIFNLHFWEARIATATSSRLRQALKFFFEENPRNFAMKIVLWRSCYYLFPRVRHTFLTYSFGK